MDGGGEGEGWSQSDDSIHVVVSAPPPCSTPVTPLQHPCNTPVTLLQYSCNAHVQHHAVLLQVGDGDPDVRAALRSLMRERVMPLLQPPGILRPFMPVIMAHVSRWGKQFGWSKGLGPTGGTSFGFGCAAPGVEGMAYGQTLHILLSLAGGCCDSSRCRANLVSPASTHSHTSLLLLTFQRHDKPEHGCPPGCTQLHRHPGRC